MKALHYLWSVPLAILLGAVAGIFIAAVTLVCGLLILRDMVFPQRPKTNPLKTKDQRPKTTHDSTTPD